jgi:flagellar basal body rod protein FlgF
VRVVSDIVCNPLGLNQNMVTNSSIDLFPNPNNGNFTLKLNGVSAKNQTMRIIDMLGREMWNGQLQETETNMEVDLAAGKYYLAIVFVDGQAIRKSFVVVD